MRLRSVWDILLIRSISPAARRHQAAHAVLAVLAVTLLAHLLGCGGSTSATITPTSITVQGPTTATVDPGDSASFTATVANDANSAGVTWSLNGTTCTAAACGTLTHSTTTGVTFTAPATVAAPFTVTLTVASVTSPSLTTVITLHVAANLSIATAAGALPGAVVGMPYSTTLAGAGGVTPYTWSVTQGTLAAGLILSPTTGVLSGSPSAAGNVTFTVTLSDSGSPALTSSATYTLAVVYPQLSITTATNLPNGTVGTAYAATLSATGGTGTGYTWAVTSGTALSAAGLALSPSGAITGTPTASEAADRFTVTVTDSFGDQAAATLQLTIAYPALTINTTTLPNGIVGTAYAATLSATGGSGSGYTWAVTSGTTLSAAGLTLSPAGAITGSPTTSETSAPLSVKVTDSAGNTASATLSLTVAYPALTIGTTTLPNGIVGTAYAATLSATGGSGSGYTWAVTSGTALSAVGLTLSPAGAITGTPTTEETSSPLSVKVTDGAGNTASATLNLTILYPVLTITTASLPPGIVGTAYSQTLTASSGSGTGYTWTVTNGASSLASLGLTLSTAGVLSGGTPIAGTATFTVQVTDSLNDTATASLTLIIDPTLTITTTSLSAGTEGTPYTSTLAASGGSGSGYTWTVTAGTGLSAVGLTLTSAGAITGTPTAGESSVPFTVQVTDANGNKATATLTLSVTAVVFQGQVLSGQQPVSGATLQLYTVGSTGNGSAATPMLVAPVVTDTIGMFNLAGNYTCGQSSSGQTISASSNQVYLVATGGSTSTTALSGNSAIVMVAAVGPCTNLATTPFFTLNELTTAAAAWALSPFTSSATSIGATSTNTLGITNAFLDAALLANPANGTVATLPSTLSIEAGKLNALADALNSCASSPTGSTCSPLFAAATPTGGTAPTDIFTAALNIVKHPGQNVAAVFATLPTTPPFATSLIQSPNDWTMSLTVTGGGLSSPTALGIDSLNNIWVANQAGPLSAFNAQGTPLSPTGFGASNHTEIIQENGIAIDPSDNIWITNQNGYGGGGSGNVVEFYGARSGQIGVSPLATGYINDIYFPDAVAADTNGNIFIVNTGPPSVTVYSPTAALVSANLGVSQGLALVPVAIAIDAQHGFWLPGGNTVAHISAPTPTFPNGQLLSNPNCCQLSNGVATDALGNLWVADYLGGTSSSSSSSDGSFADIAPDGTILYTNVVTGGINHPAMVAVDAAQNAWFTNFASASITEIAGNTSASPTTALSPSTGVYSVGGFGLDASLNAPFSIAPDRSGNLWVSNQNVYAVTMFFGLAAPTVTPLQPVPTAP